MCVSRKLNSSDVRARSVKTYKQVNLLTILPDPKEKK